MSTEYQQGRWKPHTYYSFCICFKAHSFFLVHCWSDSNTLTVVITVLRLLDQFPSLYPSYAIQICKRRRKLILYLEHKCLNQNKGESNVCEQDISLVLLIYVRNHSRGKTRANYFNKMWGLDKYTMNSVPVIIEYTQWNLLPFHLLTQKKRSWWI